MSTKILRKPKIDKFLFTLGIVMVVLAGITIFTFRQIFAAFITAYEIEEVDDRELKIDRNRLDEASKAAGEKGVVPLELKDELPVEEPEVTPGAREGVG